MGGKFCAISVFNEKMKKNIIRLFFSVLAFAFVSCQKESSQIDSAVKGELTLKFDHLVGGKKLQLNTEYKNAANETFTISTVKYYISNVVVTNSEGATFVVPQNESYFLIEGKEGIVGQAKVNVPEGDYTKVSFVLGVDSLRNEAEIDKLIGDLDPANGMHWGWNSGFIFFKMEGSSDVSTAKDKKYRYHIGGFGKYETVSINNTKTIAIDLTAGGISKVRKDKGSQIHLMVDLLKVFNGNTQLSIAANSTVMLNEFSKTIADNYKDMFSHHHTH